MQSSWWKTKYTIDTFELKVKVASSHCYFCCTSAYWVCEQLSKSYRLLLWSVQVFKLSKGGKTSCILEKILFLQVSLATSKFYEFHYLIARKLVDKSKTIQTNIHPALCHRSADSYKNRWSGCILLRDIKKFKCLLARQKPQVHFR